MAKTNLSLGNLVRATTGTARSGQSSLNSNNGNGGTQVSLSDFAVDSVTHNHVFTYIIEGTSETLTTSFGSAGSRHSARVAGVSNNYTVTSGDTGQFTVSGTPPNFSINAQARTSGAYAGQSAGAVISATYADGFNTNATGYNVASTKTIYVVDTYNSINDVYCVSTDTQIQLADGSLVDAGDIYIGDELLAFVPADLPDENDVLAHPWNYWYQSMLSGSTQNVVVKNVFFNFVDKFYNINNGLLKVTETHPLFVYDAGPGVYKFKQAMDIRVGDKLVKWNTTTNEVEEVLIESNALIPTSIEVVTIDVENSDVYLTNGFVSHNKGSETIKPVPNDGLRMYLHPQYTTSQGVNSTDWLDLSGYKTGFRQIGSPTLNTSPYSWTLNGTSQYFYKPANGSADLLSTGATEFNPSAFSILMWIKTPATLATATLFSKTNGSSKDYELAMTSTNLQLNSNVFGNVSVAHSLSTSAWNFVSVTLSGTTTKFYKNGVQLGADQTTTAGTANNSYPLYIGGGVGTYFNNQIGECLYYGKALSATEVADIYNNTKSSYGL